MVAEARWRPCINSMYKMQQCENSARRRTERESAVMEAKKIDSVILDMCGLTR
jgi:hypothetical protein